jgi:hypothetical protein
VGKGARHQLLSAWAKSRARAVPTRTQLCDTILPTYVTGYDEIEPVNAIDLEVIYQSTLQIARELTLNMLRTGYSTIINRSG